MHDLIADGYIGEVQGSILVGSGMGWGNVTDRNHAYLFDAANGATVVLSIPILHALDALSYMLGDFTSVSANLVANQQEVLLMEEHKSIPVTSPNYASIIGIVNMVQLYLYLIEAVALVETICVGKLMEVKVT